MAIQQGLGGCTVSKILNSRLDSILEGTSRSFYLSLKQLPSAIRSQISLLYLLARTSDTIADSTQGTLETRLEALRKFGEFAHSRSAEPPELSELAEIQGLESEGDLLRNAEGVVGSLSDFSESDQTHILRCLEIIISGQTLDLERFSGSVDEIVPLSDDAELDDYAYRVAGSVGEFWTRMSLEHIFQVSPSEESELFEKGIRFGKALQMINILRDIPADLRSGRCYIPMTSLSEHGMEPSDLTEESNIDRFRPLYDRYLDLTDSHLEAAVQYIGMIPHGQFRLRGSCMLPVVIGKQTVSLLRAGNVLDYSSRIKIQRSDIEKVVSRVIMAVPFPGRSQKLLEDG